MEEREHRVELPLRERVVLVVVALCAADSQSEPGVGDRVEAVHGLLEALLGVFRARLPVLDPIAQEAGRHALLYGRPGQQVAGDLLHGEAIERLVAIDRFDDPLTPAPGVRPQGIALVALAVGVARQVEPWQRPALAEMRRLEHLVHQGFVALAVLDRRQALEACRGRRQPDQIEMDPATQRVRSRLRRRLQALGLEPGQHEAVDRIARPALVANRRRIGAAHRLERPVRVGGGLAGRSARIRSCVRVGPVGTLGDPVPQRGDLGRTQGLPSRRHAKSVPVARDPLDQPAGPGVARDNHGACVAPSKSRSAAVKAQSGHLLLPAVAQIAALMEDRLDVAGVVGSPQSQGRREQDCKRGSG